MKQKLSVYGICLLILLIPMTLYASVLFFRGSGAPAGDGFVGENGTPTNACGYDADEAGDGTPFDACYAKHTASAGGTISYVHIEWDTGQTTATNAWRIEIWHYTGSDWEFTARTNQFTASGGSDVQDDIALTTTPTVTLNDTYALILFGYDSGCSINAVVSGTHYFDYGQVTFTSNQPDVLADFLDGQDASEADRTMILWADNSAS